MARLHPRRRDQVGAVLVGLAAVVAVIVLALGQRMSPDAVQSGLGTAHSLGELAPTSACPIGSTSELLCLHNWARRRHGLRVLRWYSPLARAATLKANAIARTGEFSHTPGGIRWDAYFPRLCGRTVCGEAENIAWNFSSKRATFAAWLASPEHRANILTNWLRLYGSHYRADRKLWVVDFGA